MIITLACSLSWGDPRPELKPLEGIFLDDNYLVLEPLLGGPSARASGRHFLMIVTLFWSLPWGQPASWLFPGSLGPSSGQGPWDVVGQGLPTTYGAHNVPSTRGLEGKLSGGPGGCRLPPCLTTSHPGLTTPSPLTTGLEAFPYLNLSKINMALNFLLTNNNNISSSNMFFIMRV